MSQHLIKSIMASEFPVGRRELPIREAVALLVEHRAEALPVTRDDGTLEGILTQKDCFRPVLHASYHQEWAGQVADYMTESVVTVEAGDDVVRAAEQFLHHPHRVFPVIDNGRLVGMLHRADVLALLMQIG